MEATDLIKVEKTNALQIFAADDTSGVDRLIDKVAEHVRSLVPDTSTKKGRDAIASAAHKVAKCKTYLESIGKEEKDKQAEIPRKIDANRRHIKERMDKLRDEVREPLNEWEKEQQRIENERKAVLSGIRAQGSVEYGTPPEEIAKRIEALELQELDQEQLADHYILCAEAKIAALAALRQAHTAAVQREKEQEELAELRRMKAQQEQAEQEKATQQPAQQTQQAPAHSDDDFSDFGPADTTGLLYTEDYPDYAVDSNPSNTTFIQPSGAATNNGNSAPTDEHKAMVERVALQGLIDGGLPQEHAEHAVRLIVKGRAPNIHITY
ncbi:hypothetical protein [Zhongshania sp.]|uniref:hypothetical protein n=1 Tax=Zhongshania sp. TaxID=1971902 RepID=UPI003563D9E9